MAIQDIDVSTALPTGRFMAINAPVALPGCCLFCRGHKGPFIDSGISHPGHGAIYACASCIQSMFDTLNLVGANSVQMRQQMYRRGHGDGFADAISRVRAMTTSIEASHAVRRGEVISELVDVSDPVITPASDPSPSDPIVPESEIVPADPGSEPEDIPEPESPAVEVSGATVVEGRDDLPSDSDDGALDESDSSVGDSAGLGEFLIEV